ncbi:hypothetical protein M8C21_030033, partial [Ambrosia artemisiifolia]
TNKQATRKHLGEESALRNFVESSPPRWQLDFKTVDIQKSHMKTRYQHSECGITKISDNACIAYDFNRPGKTCLRSLEWVWGGGTYIAKLRFVYCFGALADVSSITTIPTHLFHSIHHRQSIHHHRGHPSPTQRRRNRLRPFPLHGLEEIRLVVVCGGVGSNEELVASI